MAIPGALALAIGNLLGTSLGRSDPGLAVACIALSIALGRPRGGVLPLLGVGWLLASTARPPDWVPDLERPVVLLVSLEERWRSGDFGLGANCRAEWLRQGIEIRRWNRSVRVYLPRGMPAPEGRRLRLTGTLRRPSTVANGVVQQAPPWQLRVKAAPFVERRLPVERGAVGDLMDSFVDGLRERLDRRLGESAGRWPASGRLVEALILGRSDALSEASRRSLRAAGLAHVFALSGLHIGLLAACASQLTLGIRFGPRLLVIVTLVLLYGLLAGDRPSLVRSMMMLFALLGSSLLRRPSYSLNSLAWIGAAMLATGPRLILEVAFQLSFAATWGILVLAPRFHRRWTVLPSAIRLPLSVSVGAHVAGLPWALSVFHIENPLSPLVFLLIVPWVVVSLVVALGWTLCALTGLPAAPLDAVLHAMGVLLERMLELPWTGVGVYPSSLGWGSSLVISAGVVAVLLSARPLAIGMLTVLLTLGAMAGGDRETVEVVVLDVGQGDAILLRDGKHGMLVDGGGWLRGDIAQRVLVPALANLGLRRLTSMALTHPDNDHCAGLIGLASYLSIDTLYLSAGWLGSDCVEGLVTLPGVEARPLWRGQRLTLGRWRLRVLHPAAGQRRERNNRSLVLLAEYRQARVLLTGDLESAGEREIMQAFEHSTLPSIDLLKVSHHGSGTSTSTAWIDRLRPRLAVISCGRGNRYGHPASAVLERLQRQRVATLRTDRDGGIRVRFTATGQLRIAFLAGS